MVGPERVIGFVRVCWAEDDIKNAMLALELGNVCGCHEEELRAWALHGIKASLLD